MRGRIALLKRFARNACRTRGTTTTCDRPLTTLIYAGSAKHAARIKRSRLRRKAISSSSYDQALTAGDAESDEALVSLWA